MTCGSKINVCTDEKIAKHATKKPYVSEIKVIKGNAVHFTRSREKN